MFVLCLCLMSLVAFVWLAFKAAWFGLDWEGGRLLVYALALVSVLSLLYLYLRTLT